MSFVVWGCLAQVSPNHSRGYGERPGIRLVVWPFIPALTVTGAYCPVEVGARNIPVLTFW
jgi:hypothetical protein